MANRPDEERSIFEKLINTFGPLREEEKSKMIEATDADLIRAMNEQERRARMRQAYEDEVRQKKGRTHAAGGILGPPGVGSSLFDFVGKYPLVGKYPRSLPTSDRVDPLSWLDMEYKDFGIDQLKFTNPPPIPSPSIEADMEKMETALKAAVAENHVMQRIIEIILDFNTNVYDNMNPGGKIFPSVSLRSVSSMTYKIEFQITQESGLLNKELFSAVRECNIRGLSEQVVKSEITALLVDALLHLMSLSLYRLVSSDDSVSL